MAKIRVLGNLTAAAEEAMEAAYQQACSYNSQHILIEFDGKSHIDSAGIAIVLNLALKSQEEEREIFFTGLSEHFQKIFKLVGLTKFITIVTSEEEIRKL